MITREKSEKNTLKLNLEANKEEWAKALELAYETTKGKYNVQGFRKGKIPRKVIEKTYGDTVFYDEALDRMIAKEYSDFLAQNPDVEPVDHPRVTINSITEDGVKLTIEVDLMPEVELGAWEGLKITKNVEAVTDEKVDAEIKKLLERNSRFNESEESAEMGDFATIDFVGSIDGKVFDGGTAEDYRLELGSHSFIDNFEEQIVGMKKGDKKDIKVKFPEGYPAKELSGKDAKFEVTLKKLEKKEVPELSDKFVADTTEFENIADYKKDIKSKLEKEAEKAAEKKAENELLEKIVKNAKIDIPHSIIHKEIDYIIEDIRRNLAYQQISLEQYLEITKISMDEFKMSKHEEAEESVKTRMVLQKIIKDNNITVTKEDYNNRIEEFAVRSGKTIEEFDQEISDYERRYINNDILMTKLMNLLKEKNTIE